MPASSGTGRAHERSAGTKCCTWRGWPSSRWPRQTLPQLVEQLRPHRGLSWRSSTRSPSASEAPPFIAGPERGGAARRRGRARCRWRVRPQSMAPGIRGRLLPGAAARRDGGVVNARAAVAQRARPAAAASRRRAPNAPERDARLVAGAARRARRRASTRHAASRPGGRSPACRSRVKDNIVTLEQPTTCGSRILEGYVSPFDATVVDRLRAAGALIAVQGQPRRVRHGLVHRALGLRAGAASRSIRRACPAAPPAGRRRWSPPAWCPRRSARRPAARCASRPASAASSASSRPTAG